MIFRFLPEAHGHALAAAAVLALAATGCADRSFTWTGDVYDTDAVGAITVADGALRAYVCGGPTTYSTLSRWLEGRVDSSNSFEATADGWWLRGYVGDDYAGGQIEAPNGETFYLDATSVEDELSGLYSVEDSGCRTGVVVSNGALQGTWCDDEGHFAQVTPVYPIELTERGIHVQVDLGSLGLGGVRDLYVTRDSAR